MCKSIFVTPFLAVTKFIALSMLFLLGLMTGDDVLSAQDAPDNSRVQSPLERNSRSMSLTRYATDDFFGGAFVDLDTALASASYQNFPFDRLISSAIVFDRYRSASIRQIAVFIKNPAELRKGESGTVELAAAARVLQSGEPKQTIAKIAARISPLPRKPDLAIEKIDLDNRTCYQVPAGTFLNNRDKTGSLHFTAEDGSRKPRGINVGDVAPIEYLQGSNKQTAVFTIPGVDESDLREGRLELNIRMVVFRTRMFTKFSKVEIFLRQPGGKIASDPIRFDAISYTNSTVSFPRRMSTSDANGDSQEIDLFKDLVLDGQLEVVVRGFDEFVYFGFDPESVRVKTNASEYVVFNNPDVLVAQSMTTLTEMLRHRGETELGQQLQQSNREIVVAASVSDNIQRQRLLSFLDALQFPALKAYLPKTDFKVFGAAAIGERTAAKLQMSFQPPSRVAQVGRRMLRDLAAARKLSKAAVIESNRRMDTMDQLRSIVLPGIPQRQPVPNLDRAKFEQHLASCIDHWFDGIQVETSENRLTVGFEQVKPLVESSRLDQLALSTLELRRVFQLFHQNQFYLSDRIHRHVTKRLSQEESAWARRAHQLTYNTSAEFEGFQQRYQWVRRGIQVLIDGAEYNPESSDLPWMAANFIALKIGLSDERKQYQKLFAEDTELHARLAGFIDLEAARIGNGQIESWLVAKLLFQYCIDQHVQSGKRSSIPPFFFFSRPARAQAGFAAALDERGELVRGASQWKNAQQLYNDFGEIPIPVSGTLRLDKQVRPENGDSRRGRDASQDLMETFPRFGSLADQPDQVDPIDEKISDFKQTFRRWGWRARFEQTEMARSIRRDALQARQLIQQNQRRAAYRLYHRAMEAILEISTLEPEHNDELFEAVQGVYQGYQRVAAVLKLPIDDSFSGLIQGFENAESNSGILSWR